MKTKRVLCPQRLRHVPHRFSWIDQRLVRDGHTCQKEQGNLLRQNVIFASALASGFCS